MQFQLPRFNRLLLVASCSAALAGCGGGTSTNTTGITPAIATTGTTTGTAPVVATTVPVSVVGRITAFGSIYVNGVRYDTSNANVEDQGPEGARTMSESDLKIGMVVNLTGSRTGTTGVANSVSYNELVEAPITAVSLNNAGTGTITAGGKTINVSSTTVFYGGTSRAAITALTAGDWIEVSGFVSADGSIDATMVSYESDHSQGSRAELEGVISNLDTAAQTFTLNGLQVNYGAAALGSLTSLSNGMVVEVSGTLDTTTNQLTAAYIEREDSDHHSEREGYEYELQGIVSGATTGQFMLAGVTVVYSGTTWFSGLAAADVRDGLFIEVEGAYNEAGQFVARKVELEGYSSDDDYHSNELEVESTVSAIDTTNNTITVLGYTIAITASTLLKDDDHGEYYFNIGSLSVGDYVEAVLTRNTDNTYTLRKLEREHAEQWSSIEGAVSQVNADGSVVIGATTVRLPAGRTAAVGQRIEVEGTFDTASNTLNGVHFEYDD